MTASGGLPDAPTARNTENKDVSCYLTTKHSWKGKYKRIFSVGTSCITTYNPTTLEITNQWSYSDFTSIKPLNKPGSIPGEFQIKMKLRNKSDTMRFSSEYSPEILTQALSFRHLFAEPCPERKRFNAYKVHWSENRIPIVLEVSDARITQIDQRTGRVLAHYNYKDIEFFVQVSDCPGGFCIVSCGYQRLHFFAGQASEELMKCANTAAFDNIGVGCKIIKEPISTKEAQSRRLGHCGADEQITSIVEFTVYKKSPRHEYPVRRYLCLSETCVLERDPDTYSVVTIRPLSMITCLVRTDANPQQFYIEYDSEDVRCYTCTERDNVLATLLDGVRAAGNTNVHVTMKPYERGLRVIPYTMCLDDEGEGQLMKHVTHPPPGMKRFEALQRLNANVPFSGFLFSVTQEGFFTENKEKLIVNCVQSIVFDDSISSAQEWECHMHALHRLFASKAGFHSFTNTPGLRERLGNKVINGLNMENEAVNHASIEMLCALLQPMHGDYELRQEQANKSSLLHSKKFLNHLLEVMSNHVVHGTGALVITSMLDFLTYSLCAPYSETTKGDQFDQLLQLVAAKGRTLFKLFLFPSMTIVKGTGLVMRAIIEESEPANARRMQELSLAEGALLRHLHSALFISSKDVRMLTNRQLSRRLLALWCTDNEAAMQLLTRCLPKGLLNYLDSTEEVPLNEDELLCIRNNLNIAQMESDEKTNVVKEQLMEAQRMVEKQLDSLLQHWKIRQKLNFLGRKEEKLTKQPITLRKRRQRIKSVKNWNMFFYQFTKDHSQSDLIWNHKTREELRDRLDNELRALTSDQEIVGKLPLSWNHQEFEVEYVSLKNEVRIGDYFLRILLEEDKNSENPTEIHEPYAFFNQVYHHFLLSTKPEMRCLCLQALAVIYGRHWEDIGPFPDTHYIIEMLDKCMDCAERDHLLVFVSKLILHQRNVRDVIVAGGISILIDLMTLAHLHVNRAHVHTQTNVIEAGNDMVRDGALEWYFSVTEGEKQGPISFQELKKMYNDGELTDKMRCWAQGLEGWRPLKDVPQLRWKLCAGGKATMNETDMSIIVLETLIRMCEFFPSRDIDDCVVRPLPRVKKILSQPSLLPHLVQLLLTFQPTIVERTATLLYLLMQDNPYLPRLYLSGLFFFILMYTGSNVLPIAKLLHYSHMQQAFRSETAKSDIIQRSVLSPLLPEATVYYLENYGADKYANVFLGEFDNPEVIWNSEMRRQMIEKVAAHIGDFSHRLPSNVRALYQYCPIPEITYPQTENELFCNIYYLRHLCDTSRFPDWPIKDPIEFLKSCLSAWNEEIERKPPSMSVEDACNILNMTLEEYGGGEGTIRKAYYKLAPKFHPDRNPEGREMFEKLSAAYELLCSQHTSTSAGPDPARIVLCIKAQTIVFMRHNDVLKEYKYAGYNQLFKTIRMETQDESLFSKGAPLLAAATELCYYTLACSALNAEQLRRENGLLALSEAFSRCVSVLNASSKPSDLAAQVCLHICRCFSTAAQFEACRERISEMSTIFPDICRVLFFRHLLKLNTAASDCVRCMAVSPILQTQLLEAGVLWYIIPNLFQFDFTLDEGGVEKSVDNNTQEMQNTLARESCKACAALAGYTEECPPNDKVQECLLAMLTYHINTCMKTSPTDYVLKLLNCNTENPYLIWDNSTRAELLEFVESQRTSTEKTSKEYGAEFKFSIFGKELVIGHIFIRVYNEQPNFRIEVVKEPKLFIVDLLDFLSNQAQYLHSLLSLGMQNGQSETSGNRLVNVTMAMQAVRNLITNNPGLEILCIGHFRLLFAYLRVDSLPSLQMEALEVISLAAANSECISDIAASSTLVYLLLLLKSLPKSAPYVLSVLGTLFSNKDVSKEARPRGALLYLLDLFCNQTDGDVRMKASSLLNTLQKSQLDGKTWKIDVDKFLPPLFSDAFQDSSSSSVHMFDMNTENPELIWTEETRNKVKALVSGQVKSLYEMQKDNPDFEFKLSSEMECPYADVSAGELVVGGVYIRLLISNPSWTLHDPRKFLPALIDRLLKEIRKSPPNGDVLETLTTALVGYLANHPDQNDSVGTMGYLPQLCDSMNSTDKNVCRSSILVFQQITSSQVCINHLANVECLPNLIVAMKKRPDLLHSACQGLRTLFSKDIAELVKQALNCNLVPYLLSLLDSSLQDVDNPQNVKAEVVKTLKAMQTNEQFGPQISEILAESKVWAEFKDQLHDLFIQNTPQIGYLTGGTAAAGYLTQGMIVQPREVPPP